MFISKYVSAIAIAVIAILIRSLLQPWLGEAMIYVPAFAGVVLAAWFFGRGPAYANLVLGFIGTQWFILGRVTAEIFASPLLPSLGLYTLLNALIIHLVSRLRLEHERLRIADSERKKVEEQLQALNRDLTQRNLQLANERARWRGVVEGMAEEVWACDLEGKMSLMNLPSVTQMGLEEFEGKSVEEVLQEIEILNPDGKVRPPEDAPLLRVLRNGQVVRGDEIMLHRRTGTMRHRHFSAAPTRDEKGVINGAVAIVSDITDRRKADERLELLSAAFSSAANGTIITDVSGRIIWANPAFCKLTGYSDKEIIGQNPRILKSGRQNSECYDDLWRTITEGKVWHGELINKRKDGSLYHEEMTITPVRAEGKEVSHFVAVKQDITERIRVEETLRQQAAALRESEERLRVSFDNAALGIVEADATGRFTAANKRFCQILGYSREELLQKTVHELTFPEDRPRSDELNIKLYLGELPLLDYEKRYLKKDGSPIWVHVTVSVVRDEKGRFLRFIGTMEDISERKKAEEERAELEARRQQAHKLESIGILAGGIAHDFNNLLTGLFGYLEIARLYAASGAITQVTSSLNSALEALDRAKALTQQLLTFSRGGVPIKKTADISMLLKNAISFSLSGSKIKAELICENLWACEIDENQLSQAIDNLLLNAKEAMRDDGKISVAGENLTVGLDWPASEELPAGNYVHVTIADQGPGIAPENMSRIFDPFFTTKESGHGLGLSITYSIVKKHGGLITVNSTMGAGTAFHLFLPASGKALPEKETAKSIEHRGAGKVLIMDDEQIVAGVAKALLEHMGYKVDYAVDGSEALRLYKAAMASNKPYKLVILDLTVRGGMGGLEAVQELQRLDPQVIAIVSSGYSNEQILANPHHFGFKAAIAKPYRASQFKDVLNQVLHPLEPLA